MKTTVLKKQIISKRSQGACLGFLALILMTVLTQGCRESCDTQMISFYEPVMAVRTDVIRDAMYVEPRDIENPGKLYYKDEFLFINEVDQGIHVIDNRNKLHPQTVGFIDLPGNRDLAAMGNFLYADNYTDLVVLDISNKSNIVEVNRIENVFENYYYETEDGMMIIDYVIEEREVEMDCDEPQYWSMDSDLMAFAESSNSAGAGIGGSMARFTIAHDYLYTVNDYRLKLFDIGVHDSPVEGATVYMDWGIETIFPYEDKLFFGARSGMHIYDNSDPALPVYISTYQHVNTCDPVVVQGDLAYVTLRSGTTCETFTNQLDVIDITDVANPELLVSHPMQNPHGLGIKGSCLFIAEGDYGLKVYNAQDPMAIADHLIVHHQDVHALDVIPLDDVLFMIGNDGLHQYSYDCSNQFYYLSTISF